MARPKRNTVDYFPFICQEGKKMFYIEQTYGNDGFATFIKILRELALTENHYLNLSDHSTLMFLSAKCRVSTETLLLIINDLVNLGKFDSVLWNDNKIIWCQDFIENIQDAYIKRTNKCIDYEGLLTLLCSLGVRKPPKKELKEGINPHSIVEYTKEDKSKVYYRAFAHLKLSFSEFDKLNIIYNQTQIDNVLDAIENYKDNKKYTSLYLTAKKWLSKEFPKQTTPEVTTKPKMVY